MLSQNVKSPFGNLLARGGFGFGLFRLEAGVVPSFRFCCSSSSDGGGESDWAANTTYIKTVIDKIYNSTYTTLDA